MKVLIIIVSFCIVTASMAAQTVTDCPAMVESREIAKKDLSQKKSPKKQVSVKQ